MELQDLSQPRAAFHIAAKLALAAQAGLESCLVPDQSVILLQMRNIS
jgi:hypothetical protein